MSPRSWGGTEETPATRRPPPLHLRSPPRTGLQAGRPRREAGRGAGFRLQRLPGARSQSQSPSPAVLNPWKHRQRESKGVI